ncbi:PLD nuclease N-terminal domain-containing protein [Spiractinospora alimapuensis]|uniref:PLD nuclease N-terminal domain-containing protein n=1 Tax=Spiractinospora alimapuensis TaxID=2820884 RepID=UPI001F2136AD|nr:PLD nuclease N-terminal domain-containing protein [Spiractinospora alimapuensis]
MDGPGQGYNEGLAFFSGLFAVLAGIALLALIVLVIWALVSILAHKDLTGGGKLLWVIGVLWVPLFGAVAWFVVGRKGNINRLLGIDKGRGEGTAPSGPQTSGPSGSGGVVPPSPA